MPRKYKRRYRKRGRKSVGAIVAARTGSPTMGNIANVAMTGYRLAKKIARLINVEVKHYTDANVLQPANTGLIADLCDPAQGHDQDERNGDSIKPLHLTIRGQVYSDASGGSAQYLRLIIFRFKDENAVALVPDDILMPSMLASSTAIFSPKNWDKKFHSKILYDKLFRVGNYLGNAAGQDSNIPNTVPFKFSTKLYGHINWTDSTSTEEGGGIYMLVVSAATAAADAPSIQYCSRVTFTDN